MSNLLSQAVRAAGSLVQALLLAISAVLLGFGLGIVIVRYPLYGLLLGAGAAGLVLAWWMFKRPPLTVMAFWVFFTAQGTIISGLAVQGLYYPLYLVMLFNLLVGLALGLYRLPTVPLVLYGLFLGTVLLGLFRLAGNVDFSLYQRIFIYVLGLLTFFQFRSLGSCRLLPKAQIVAALIVSLWVVTTALQGGFAGNRVEISEDQNSVSGIVALGLIPLFVHLLTGRDRLLSMRRIPLWLAGALGVYAMLLLASRGQAIALVMALFVIVGRIIFRLGRGALVLVVAALVAVLLVNLPGSENLTERFTSADISSANGRLVIWQATMQGVLEASPYELVLGHGFDSNKALVRSIAPSLTSTHNSYLQILYEFGLVGFGFFLALHAWLLWGCWRYHDRIALTALGALVFLSFSSLSVTATDWFLYWIVLGHVLAVVVWKRQAEIEVAT